MSPFAVDIIVLIDLLVWGIFIGLFLKCFRLFFCDGDHLNCFSWWSRGLIDWIPTVTDVT